MTRLSTKRIHSAPNTLSGMSRTITIAYILLAFGLAVGGGSLGASLARSHRRLCVLISIGAGSLLGVTIFDILPETFEALTWWGLLLAFGSGYGVFALITRYVFHVCPACAASHFDEVTTHRFGEIARGMMIALSIHCTADGNRDCRGARGRAWHMRQEAARWLSRLWSPSACTKSLKVWPLVPYC